MDDEKLKGLEGMKKMDEFTKMVLTASGHNDQQPHESNENEERRDETTSIQDPNIDANEQEEEEEHVAGNLDTLVTINGVPELNEKFVIAPGEGRYPQSILQEKESEVLSYPSLYAGQSKGDIEHATVKITKGDERCWELRSEDRRVADNQSNMFFKVHHMYKEKLRSVMVVKLRIKNQPNKTKLNAGVLRDNNALRDLADKYVILPEFKII